MFPKQKEPFKPHHCDTFLALWMCLCNCGLDAVMPEPASMNEDFFSPVQLHSSRDDNVMLEGKFELLVKGKEGDQDEIIKANI